MAIDYRHRIQQRQRFPAYISTVEKKNLHIGKRIRQKMKELRLRPVDLYTKMQIKKQAFYYHISRPSMDTRNLQRFSELIGYNFFLDFITPQEMNDHFNSQEFIAKKDYQNLANENVELKKQLDETRIKYIAMLEKRPEKKEHPINVKVNGHS